MFFRRISRHPALTGTRVQQMPFTRIFHLLNVMILKYVIILSGDQICKQDYSDFLRFHKEKGAEFSVAVMEVPWDEASRFGLMVADENDRITEFQEKPEESEVQSGFHGYLHLQLGYPSQKYLEEDEAGSSTSENDFGNNIIPNLPQRWPPDVCLSFQRLLEGCRNHLFSVGS